MNKLSAEEEDEVARCRRVREELDRQCTTLDDAFKRLDNMAKSRKRRGAARATQARRVRLAQQSPTRKATRSLRSK